MLALSPNTVAWIILKAREFDSKDAPLERDDDEIDDALLGDISDDEEEGEDAGDPLAHELTSWIDDMNDTEQAELVALYWLGRGDGDADDFTELTQQARESRVNKTSTYLLGAPMLPDYLEEGLEALGYDTSELETEAIGPV
jgi:hypothetical protein